MNKDIKEARFIKSFEDVIAQMYRLGWDERNAGNVSYLLSDEEISTYKHAFNRQKTYDLQLDIDDLVDNYILVTGSGKYFKNVKEDIEKNACIIHVTSKNTYDIVWGLSDDEKPTSELSTHLMAHQTRLKIDPKHKVIIHTHATYINHMSAIYPLDEREFTRKIWKLNTENIIIIPEGIGIVPWEIPGNKLIGIHTSEKLRKHRIVLWPLHGVVASGETLDDTFGLIETVEKAAHMYMTIK
jgi:rhamnulose-1-phosphate aldolase